VSLKGALLADLRQERAMINFTKKILRDGEGQFPEVKPMEKEKKDILSELESFKKVLVARTKALNQLRQKRHWGDSPIRNGLEKLLAILGIDRAAYHRGDLNGKNVQQMFQESDNIFWQFKVTIFPYVDKWTRAHIIG
jgi:hypothetical protein